MFDANWKLIHGTFLESYHVFSLHRDTIAGDLLSTPFVGENFGPHRRGVVMRKEATSLLERPESEWELRPFASIVGGAGVRQGTGGGPTLRSLGRVPRA